MRPFCRVFLPSLAVLLAGSQLLPVHAVSGATAAYQPRNLTRPAVVQPDAPVRNAGKARFDAPAVHAAASSLYFEPNAGQLGSDIAYLARGSGLTAYFSNSGVQFQLTRRVDEAPAPARFGPARDHAPKLDSTVVRMELKNANPGMRFLPEEKLNGVSAYFRGSDPSKWLNSVPHYSRIRALDVYDGIDAVYYADGALLEYDFVVRPGADPSKIHLAFQGTRSTRVDRAGNLVLETAFGDLVHGAPRVYQRTATGQDREIAASYKMSAGGGIRFELARYDRSRDLIIDPVLRFSTFLGGAAFNSASGIAVDQTGAVYVTGANAATEYSLVNALAPNGATNQGGNDAVVSKLVLNPVTNVLTLAYATFMGGSGNDAGNRIAVDAAGSAYIAGSTASPNFPVVNALPVNGFINRGNGEGFVAKLNFNGASLSLAYSTFLGGTGVDDAVDVAVDSSGAAYVTGFTGSIDFPVANPISQGGSGLQGGFDAFVSKLSFNPGTNALALSYSTYLGGADSDGARCIAVDSAGAAYVAGSTLPVFGANDFPIVRSLPPNGPPTQGIFDGFVSKLEFSPGSLSLSFSTIVRGNGNDQINGIALDSSGGVYIAGITTSNTLPVVNSVAGSGASYRGGPSDGFAGKFALNSSGTGLMWTYLTYIGSSGSDVATDIAVDTTGAAHVSGFTAPSSTGPVFPSTDLFLALGRTSEGIEDAFLLKLVLSGNTLNYGYATLLGGGGRDYGYGVDVDSSGGAYITGTTENNAAGFPTVNAISPRGAIYSGGVTQIFAARISDVPGATPRINVTKTGDGTVVSFGGSGGVINCGPTCSVNVSGTVTLTASPSAGSVFVSWGGACASSPNNSCVLNVDAEKNVSVTFAPVGTTRTIVVSRLGNGSGSVAGGLVDCGATCSQTIGSGGSITLTATAAVNSIFAGWGGACAGTANTCTLQVNADLTITATFNSTLPPPAQTAALHFVPVTPCRLVDTRNPAGPFGAPFLAAEETRSFTVPSGVCGIPSSAQAYALNMTVVPRASLAFLTVWPVGVTRPTASTLNSLDARIKANAAIVPAGTNGGINVYVTNPTEVIIDINGYFVAAGTNFAGLAFYPIAPCRIADTRNAPGPFGRPAMAADSSRDFNVPASSCNIPSTARAYSLNTTVVPSGSLAFLTMWPSGVQRPEVSTLNALTGTIVANASIVPAGTNGSISVYSTNNTELIIDINGYFAPPGGVGALSFYSVSPCRVADTRNANGTFGGPRMEAQQTRDFPISGNVCNVPSTARAYSLNATVVPAASGYAFLTLWPFGQTIPTVSTLNALDGAITSNAAIVVGGTNGVVSAYGTNPAHLILDVNGYFAP